MNAWCMRVPDRGLEQNKIQNSCGPANERASFWVRPPPKAPFYKFKGIIITHVKYKIHKLDGRIEYVFSLVVLSSSSSSKVINYNVVWWTAVEIERVRGWWTLARSLADGREHCSQPQIDCLLFCVSCNIWLDRFQMVWLLFFFVSFRSFSCLLRAHFHLSLLMVYIENEFLIK